MPCPFRGGGRGLLASGFGLALPLGNTMRFYRRKQAG
ncbi:hypothetical protein METEAL_39780 [Mesoterricola silvestris]|uniref:Uncharacterized protein n=1 Tax=Mesoterricola silvestris TaxID=2927979 RepID=A0AA48GRH5_9BACT|nr:hypothetical protein METEAL_39780 [Mesoterricola silvestris]